MPREDFCKRCSRYAGCGFISRNLQAKCDILQIFEEGYEQAIKKACEWLKEYIEWNDLCTLEDIEQFRKAMEGD